MLLFYLISCGAVIVKNVFFQNVADIKKLKSAGICTIKVGFLLGTLKRAVDVFA